MIEKIARFLVRKKAIRELKKRYLLDTATNYILKDWVTACIIERKQETRRKELIELQASIKEQEIFINWLNIQK